MTTTEIMPDISDVASKFQVYIDDKIIGEAVREPDGWHALLMFNGEPEDIGVFASMSAAEKAIDRWYGGET